MKKFLVLVSLLAAAAAMAFGAQKEQLNHSQKVSVQVGRAAAIPVERHPLTATLQIVARHPDGTVFYDSKPQDLRTNAGANWQADLMGDTSAPPVNAQCNYIALTNTAITPAATDTTLSGEITVNGLSRAQGTYAHTTNATSYSIAHTWTATASQSAQAAGMFTAASAGTMCFENTFTSVALSTNDTLTLTRTVSF